MFRSLNKNEMDVSGSVTVGCSVFSTLSTITVKCSISVNKQALSNQVLSLASKRST